MGLCVCGSGVEAEACCLPYLAGKLAPTAEALMRSRYTAYVLGNIDHVVRTSAPEALEGFNRLDAQRSSEESDWVGLEIKNVVDGGVADEKGTVELIFRYKHKGQPYGQHEIAHFYKKDGAWLYSTSDVNPKSPPERVVHIGRNDPCPCGSNKKYKKCCGA